MSILIVEDDTFYAHQLKEVLADCGLDSSIVNSTETALASDISKYNAAIIDIMLPNDPNASGISNKEARAGFLSGVVVARRFKQKDSKFPIVLFSGYFGTAEGERWAADNYIPFFSKGDGPNALRLCLQQINIIKDVKPKPKAFIVHGHDETALLELKNYIQNTLKWQEPIVLREQPSGGKTIIEKFENYASRADYVFVLMTPDDLVKDKEYTKDKRRSRQNVVFELGFFYGQFGRRSGRTIVLYKGSLELPSDIQGIAWIDISSGINKAGEDIRRELDQ